MLTIACYSEGTAYEQEADLLRASLDRVGMAHHIEPFPDGGDWYANTAHKSRFLAEARQRIRGPLLYVDVDAVVHENCTGYFQGLADEGYDYGAHWFRGPAKGYDRSKIRAEGWWMLSGTLFLGDTPGCRDLLLNWNRLNKLMRVMGVMEGGGQKNLWWMVTCMTDLKVKRLPGRYCYVFDKPFSYDPEEPRIIEHTIASRDHRAKRQKTRARANRITELRREMAA